MKPYYENEIAEFWWDTPEYQGNEEEDDTKLFRPDAKLRLKQERQIFILEMAVPWINNREIKYQRKDRQISKCVEQVEVRLSQLRSKPTDIYNRRTWRSFQTLT